MSLDGLKLCLLKCYFDMIEGVEEDEDKEAGYKMERDTEAVDQRGEVDPTPYGQHWNV